MLRNFFKPYLLWLPFFWLGSGLAQAVTNCAPPAQTEIPKPECDALLAFYHDTNGANWINNSGWNTSHTPCSWYGITCNGGHVQQITLSGNQLTGLLPPSLNSLLNLEKLDLSNNNTLSGTLPPTWGSLSNLQLLNLSYNGLSGFLPPEWSALVNLQKLYLRNNQLTGSLPREWRELSNLQELELRFNQLTGSLPLEWNQLINLRMLDLSYNLLGDNGLPLPQEWSSLTSLQEFYMSNNRMSGPLPPAWGNLSNLQALDLSYNQLSGPLPPEWSSLVNLTTLELNSNQLKGDFPYYLTSLTTLELDYNMLTAVNWQTTQTVPPLGVTATGVVGNNIQVQWTPIPYQADGGHYEVGYATTPGGPYTFQLVSGDKSANAHLITGLLPNTFYHIVVRTFTPSHSYNPNALMSDLSIEVSTNTFHTLTVTVNGLGSVTSDPAGITCGTDCSENYPPETPINLTATPSTGYEFSGWSGACTGTLTSVEVTLDTAKECYAIFNSVPPPPVEVNPPPIVQFPLQVGLIGQGNVSSSPTGIECGTDCSENYPSGTIVTLIATSAPEYEFNSWSGECEGNLTSVNVTLDAAKECSAIFAPRYILQIDLIGQGTVSSDPAGLPCQNNECRSSYLRGTVVTLTATPNPGYAFDRWGGACQGSPASLSLTMAAAKKCSATFSPFLQVNISGQGSVSSVPNGIQCGDVCRKSYPAGTTVTLTATPTPGHQFSGWRGDCSETTPTVTIPLNTPQTCVATFLAIHPLNVSLLGAGRVSSSPAGIICEPDCSENYVAQTTVTLTAEPAANITFNKWSGDCSGSSLSTSVTLTATKHCTAEFLDNQNQPIITPGYLSVPDHLSSFDFGQSNVGQPVTFQFEMVEVGNLPLEVQLKGFSGAQASEFTLLAPTFPLTIPDGAAHQPVTLQCLPAAWGLRTAQLEFTSNDPTHKLITYLLQCTGQALEDPGQPEVNSNPPVNLGDLQLGQATTFKLTSLPKVVKSEITGPQAHDFSITAEDANEITLQCQPSAAGERQALLTLTLGDLTQVSYSLHCQGLTEVVIDHPPIDIILSNQEIGESSPAGARVGTLSTLDPDSNDNHIYRLMSGGQFVLIDQTIRVAEGVSLKIPEYPIQVTSTDADGLSLTKDFTIKIQPQPRFVGEIHTEGRPVAAQVSVDAPETIMLIGKIYPSALHLGQLAEIQAIYHWTPDEDARSLTITQPLAHQQRLESEWVGTLFQNKLIGLAGRFVVELNYQVGQEVYSAQIATLTVRPNRPPRALKLSANTVFENSPPDTLIGTLSTEDLDKQEMFTYSLMENPGQHFKIVGNELRTTAWDFEKQATVKLVVRSVDLVGAFVDTPVVIQVHNFRD